MTVGLYLLFVGVSFVALAVTTLVARVADLAGLMDIPNERSSHTTPTPRGGGAAIVVSSIAAMGTLVITGSISPRFFYGIAGGGGLVAAVGFLDDRISLSARTRLLVHLVAAAWVVAFVGHVGVLQIGASLIQLRLWGYALSIIAVVWFLNIFNFMDGIDGIAASEAVFVCVATLAVSRYLGSGRDIVFVATIIGGASAGFLVRNWSPAKIFMGDVGSGYLGFVIAALALASCSRSPSAVWSWLVAAGVFVADSSVTLVCRMLRGERLSIAHRTHAYQILARRWSHAVVTVTVVAVDLGWLLPLAFLSAVKPACAFWIMLLALCPLIVIAVLVGAGQQAVSKSLKA